MKVYKYGALKPTSGADTVDAQLRAANMYRRALRDIEIGRRVAIRGLTRDNDLKIVALEAGIACKRGELETLLCAVKGKHSEDRSRNTSDDLKKQIAALRCDTKTLLAEIKEIRQKTKEDPRIIVGTYEIQERAKQLIKSARKFCGIGWGSYQAAEEAAGQSFEKTPMYDGELDNDPKRVRDKGQIIAVHYQSEGGLPVKDLYGANGFAKILPGPEGRSGRRSNQYKILRMRISASHQKPVYADFPIVMHRPLPDNCKVRWVQVFRKSVGPRRVWTVSITVSEEPTRKIEPAITGGAVAWDLGYRSVDGGIRAGKVQDEFGRTDPILVGERTLGAIAKAEELHSVRDKAFNEAKGLLSEWIKAGKSMPDSASKDVQHIAHWRSPRRLAGFVRRHGSAIHPTLCEALETWRYHDYHLWQYESGARRHGRASRKEFYRVLAARLADHYDTLVLEKMDLSDLSKKPNEEDKDDFRGARSNKTKVAPSELRDALMSAFRSRGRDIVAVDPPGTSSVCCHQLASGVPCGSWQTLSQDEMHTCTSCGAVWDRDDNATSNMLRASRERHQGARELDNVNETKEVTLSKYEKRKKAQSARAEKYEAARKALDNAAE